MLHVLFVEDNEDDALLLAHELRRSGYEVAFERVDTPTAMKAALAKQSWDVVLADYSLPQFSGLAALQLLRETGLDLPFILVSGSIGEALAVAAMKSGAHDYLLKDNLARLIPAVERELREAEVRRARRQAEDDVVRHIARAEALLRVAARLNAQLELEAVLHAVCEETARALGVPAASVNLYDEKRQAFYHAADFGLPPDYRARTRPLPRALYDEYARQMSPILVLEDLQAIPRLPDADLYVALNIRSAAGASMRRDGQLVGGLNVFAFGEVRHFTDDELALLRGLADQAAQAIAHARLYSETRHRLERLQALRNIDMAITASLDLSLTFSVFLDQVTRQLHVDAADILLLNSHTQMLEFTAGRGFRTAALQHTRLRLGESHAGRALLERRLIHIPHLAEGAGELVRAPLLSREDFVAYYAVPLMAKGQIKGVLEVFHRAALDADQEWFDFLETLAGQAAIAIDNATLFAELQRSNAELASAYDTTLEGWSRALDLRDKMTEGHTLRVTEMTMRLAHVVNVDGEEQVHIRRGALLHDIGKMGIPDGILLKPGPLTDEEWIVMRRHPIYAYDLLAPIAFLRPALDIPYCHHEKWDGTGYPRGLKGEAIPLAARLFAVVDVWDALRSDRPYRAGWLEAKVREYLRDLSGAHFDPRVVELFLHTPELRM